MRHWGCRNGNCKATVIAPHNEQVSTTTTHGTVPHTCKHAGKKRKLETPPDTLNTYWIELTEEEKLSDDWTVSFTLNDKKLKVRQSTGVRIFGCKFCKATITQTSKTPKGNLSKGYVDDGKKHDCKKFANKKHVGELPGPGKTRSKNYILITPEQKRSGNWPRDNETQKTKTKFRCCHKLLTGEQCPATYTHKGTWSNNCKPIVGKLDKGTAHECERWKDLEQGQMGALPNGNKSKSSHWEKVSGSEEGRSKEEIVETSKKRKAGDSTDAMKTKAAETKKAKRGGVGGGKSAKRSAEGKGQSKKKKTKVESVKVDNGSKKKKSTAASGDGKKKS